MRYRKNAFSYSDTLVIHQVGTIAYLLVAALTVGHALLSLRH